MGCVAVFCDLLYFMHRFFNCIFFFAFYSQQPITNHTEEIVSYTHTTAEEIELVLNESPKSNHAKNGKIITHAKSTVFGMPNLGNTGLF
jgi:hypothetical protein